MEKKGTTNAIYILENIIERVVEVQKKRYVYASLTTPRHLTEYDMMR